jgi:hypothetical protein
MTSRRLFSIAKLFVHCSLLFVGTTRAQAPDRILTFDCQMIVDRDRTLHVKERFEIVNSGGTFDGGFHRSLRIKPASAHRAKAGSFQTVEGKVDGQNAVLRSREDTNLFDIGIATETGTLSRGGHVIELSYAAKHQFAVYDTFEDLNQDISGEWPVPIEKATLEVTFPEGFPKEAGLSADTGTDTV